MQAEIAIAESGPVKRRLVQALARLSLPAVVFLTLALELALAERKFALFGGGFGQSRTIDTPLETAAFFAGLFASQALLAYLLYRLARRLHGARRDTALFHFNFLYWGSFLGSAVLVAKYQALSYFSDALSFEVIRNLGGGSILEAVRYTLSEATLILFVAAGALALYAVLFLFLRRSFRDRTRLSDANRLGKAQLAGLSLLVPALLLGINRIDDTRQGLARFNAPFALSFLFDTATDFDRDGYGFFASPPDVQPFDGSRHPFALDIPNNGIDEDGFAGDLALSDAAPAEAPPVRIEGARPHVILVVLESTRGDVIGKRFGGRPVAPTLEAIAAAGVSAPAAYSHVGFTSFSLKSLFTGRIAPQDSRGSLFDAFRANGYRTGIFSSQSEAWGGIAETANMRAADVFVDATTLREERVFSYASDSSLTVDGRALLREFDRRYGRAEAWTCPNFLYFNLQSAHFPYTYPGMDRILTQDPLPRDEIAPENRERLEATYWNAVAYNDRLLTDLVTRLRRLGAWENTLLVVTADHGESLFEQGFLGHGHMIGADQNRIPFVMNRPAALPEPVGLADMRGIILRAAGADVSPEPGATPGRVFQYIGSLDRPGSIGVADARGRFAIFSFEREALWTSASARWQLYEGLEPGSDARREADALLREWGRQRWLGRAGG